MPNDKSLLTEISSLFNSKFITHISQITQETPETTQTGLKAALPTLLMGLITKGSTPDGARELISTIRNNGYDQGVPSNYSDHLENKNYVDRYMKEGDNILGRLFGSKIGFIQDQISQFSNLKGDSSSKILKLIAPLAMSALGSRVRQFGFDSTQLTRFLADQKSTLKGFLPSNLVQHFPDVAGQAPVRNVIHHRDSMGDSMRDSVRPPAEKSQLSRMTPLLFIGALALGGYFLFHNRQPAETPVNPPHEQAGQIETQPDQSTNPVQDQVTQNEPPPTTVEPNTINAFLDTSTNQRLPLRFVFDHLNFRVDTNVLNADSIETVDALAVALKNHPNTVIRLEGYTDNRGNPEVNKKLSLARADAIKAALVEQGIDPQRLITSGFGEEKPIQTNDTEEGRKQNRRTEIVIVRR